MSLEGSLLGIYRVGPELGRGGMGTVYRAESTADGAAGPPGAVVALKVFHPELVADERAFARFRLEAEIGKEIHHEHLVRTYGIGSAEVDGQTYHFMVMELIEGQTLKGLLAELGTFPEHLLFQVADQVLAALDEIHGRAVVHRDIKPENVVITPDHRALLMDLGVARREEGRELTQAGEFIGSLSYAAPEQFTAKDVGPRADLYAFGITLFELATGANPFGDADVGAVMRIKLQEELDPPRKVAPDLDAFWDRVIATCVRREMADRFASAGELRQILKEGEQSEWWRLQTAGRTVASAEHALKRLRLDRQTPLIGRTQELAQLKKAGAKARAQGTTLLLGGPSGVGKSRLLYDYLEDVAGAGGPAVAAGRAVGAGGRGRPVRRGAGRPARPGRDGRRRPAGGAGRPADGAAAGHPRRRRAHCGVPARQPAAGPRQRTFQGRALRRGGQGAAHHRRRAPGRARRRGPPPSRRGDRRAVRAPRPLRAQQPHLPRRGLRQRRGRGGLPSPRAHHPR
ncbi:MAG: serine/threonine-protein kinase [Planctomycetota bacterium]